MYGQTTRRSIRVDPSQQRTTTSGQRIVFSLPGARAYDLRTLRVHVTASYAEYVMDPLVPPPTIQSPAECMIQQLDVLVGGAQLNTIDNYGQLFSVHSKYMAPSSEYGRRMITSFADGIEQPDFVVERVEVDAVTGLNINIHRAGSFGFVFNKWLGFLGSGATLDTGARGVLSFEMTLADKKLTGQILTFETYVTVDEVARETAYPLIEFADYRTSLTRCVGGFPFAVIQTRNAPDHRLQWIAATLLAENHMDLGTVAVNDQNFSGAFVHSALDMSTYHFDFDGYRYTHEVKVAEFLDRLSDALAGEKNAVELTHTSINSQDLNIETMSQTNFLAVESARDKPLPMGIVEVSFTTQGAAPFDSWVLLIAKYAAVF
jgi:hypothetical protein